VSAALLLAGRVAGVPAWERAAMDIGLGAAARPMEATKADDPGLCHGAAGLAHIYNRLYQATGAAPFADAARAWLARTLEMREPGRGLAGYLSLVPRDGASELAWLPDASFLTGVAGVALVLLGAVTEIEPLWDRCLLCDVPPCAEGSRP
jgi:hypothetical protein